MLSIYRFRSLAKKPTGKHLNEWQGRKYWFYADLSSELNNNNNNNIKFIQRSISSRFTGALHKSLPIKESLEFLLKIYKASNCADIRW